MAGFEYDPIELTCPPGVRSCYECSRSWDRCPAEHRETEQCRYCREVVDKEDGDYYSDYDDTPDYFVCNACEKRGVFDCEDREEIQVAISL